MATAVVSIASCSVMMILGPVLRNSDCNEILQLDAIDFAEASSYVVRASSSIPGTTEAA